MSPRLLSSVHRAWQGLRRDGGLRTWDRTIDFLRRHSPWTPRHQLVQPDVAAIAALTAVPRAAAPLASIIVPVFNKVDYTLTCLAALAACRDASSYEVIVVDDGSSDDTSVRVPAIEGVRYIRNSSNQGFIGSCNRGAAQAHGEYLVFLNNDTAVQPGWLDALLRIFESHRDAGLVGAKLLYPDGTLQEAGGILYTDGRGGNYGRFDAALDPRYTYVRDVDYCSGAAIAIRKVLFDRLGGFDDRYRPAYYEDADLSMRVREAGLRVLYQPRSLVIHFEGITSGTSETSGAKAYQVRNREIFLQRWRDTLLRDHSSWGTPLDMAVLRKPRVLLVFKGAQAAGEAAAEVDHLIAQGQAAALLLEHGELPPRLQQRWEEQGVEIWSGYWRTGVRRWVRRHGSRVREVWVFPPADPRRYGRLFGDASNGTCVSAVTWRKAGDQVSGD
ncbi:glycosyltransferase family 2 protein [Dyella sp. Tek66A03]|uniref:glycosyltransferase family 2 protein n=1 Tax=Dyella sp. Tek66A03 TaxID=3458298 RepID=UPI00403E3D8C